ncbi:hypothetical protein Plhal304r1_c035g0109111 [Plasmopara halstedii]
MPCWVSCNAGLAASLKMTSRVFPATGALALKVVGKHQHQNLKVHHRWLCHHVETTYVIKLYACIPAPGT